MFMSMALSVALSLSMSGVYTYVVAGLCRCLQARRQRSSLSILCDMAGLYFHRQQYEPAAERFAVAASHFRSDRWFALEVRLLQPLLQCYKAVGRRDQ